MFLRERRVRFLFCGVFGDLCVVVYRALSLFGANDILGQGLTMGFPRDLFVLPDHRHAGLQWRFERDGGVLSLGLRSMFGRHVL